MAQNQIRNPPHSDRPGKESEQHSLEGLLRDFLTVEKYKSPGPHWGAFAKKAKRLIRDAMRLSRRDDLSVEQYASRRACLDVRLQELEANAPQTLGQGVEMFLNIMEARANKPEGSTRKRGSGKISVGYWALLERCLNHFAENVGRRTAIKNINGMTLTMYDAELMKMQKARNLSDDFLGAYYRSVKAFINWAWASDLLENMPRKMKSFGIQITPKKIKPWLDEDVHTMLCHATERTRLYLLLMLNCGFTQKDISDLTNAEMDWDSGRIRRKRGKTAQWEGVPEVEWSLWPETLALLKQHGHKSGRVVTNEDGGQLLIHELRTVDGKTKPVKVDNIATAFARLLRKLNKKNLLKAPKSLKVFRKTSASKIGNHPQYAFLKQYFLGQASRTIADKHYFALGADAFDKAIDWLRDEYTITSIEEPPKNTKPRKTKPRATKSKRAR